MGIELMAVGGYEEVGRNMTALKIDDEVIILDMGWHLEKVLENFHEYRADEVDTKTLVEIGAFPDISLLGDWKNKVKAIVLSHAHLDHIAAAPKLLNEFNGVPVIATPFTLEVLKNLIKEEPKKPKNKFVYLNAGSKYKLSDKITIEFINATHSTPQTAIIAIHTKYGIITYANDWKFDNSPVIGKKTDIKRLKEIGKKGVICHISDSVRIDREGKTYSESVFNDMLKDIVLHTQNEKGLIAVSTFSSHIGRIKTVIELANKMGRKVALLGRSLESYVSAAEKAGLVKITDKAIVAGRKGNIKRVINQMKKEGTENYIVMLTGHQGEPNSMLDKISRGEIKSPFREFDILIFGCEVIPAPVNVANRARLERNLKRFKLRIFKDVHVSGHAAKEDHRDMLMILKPKIYIPAHAGLKKQSAAVELAREMGYIKGKTVFMLSNGDKLKII